jgi:hypothetical protein
MDNLKNKKLYIFFKILFIIFILICLLYIIYFYFFRNSKDLQELNFKTVLLNRSKLDYPVSNENVKFYNSSIKDLPSVFNFFLESKKIEEISVLKFKYNTGENGFLIKGIYNDNLFNSYREIKKIIENQKSFDFINGVRNEKYSLLEFKNNDFIVKIILKDYNNKTTFDFFIYYNEK